MRVFWLNGGLHFHPETEGDIAALMAAQAAAGPSPQERSHGVVSEAQRPGSPLSAAGQTNQREDE